MSTSIANQMVALNSAGTSTSTTKTASSTLGKDDFLKLLTTQLSNQDPLDPMDDKDMTAQLAQFSSLEQLTNISAGIDTLNATMNQGQLTNAVSYIGKSVRADGSSLSKDGDSVSALYYTLSSPITDASVNIYDSTGTLVRSVDIGSKAAGDYEYDWDGTDSSGKSMADGVYNVAITAYNADGSQVMVPTSVSGLVSGVSMSNGSQTLNLKDGRTVALTNVTEIVNPPSVASNASSSSSSTACTAPGFLDTRLSYAAIGNTS